MSRSKTKSETARNGAVGFIDWLDVWTVKSPQMIAPSSSIDEINAVTRKQDCTERICPGEKDHECSDEHSIRHESNEASAQITPSKEQDVPKRVCEEEQNRQHERKKL